MKYFVVGDVKLPFNKVSAWVLFDANMMCSILAILDLLSVGSSSSSCDVEHEESTVRAIYCLFVCVCVQVRADREGDPASEGRH